MGGWAGRGIDSHRYGRIEMNVGYGEHTTHYSTVVMAEESLALEDFRAALLAAKVSEKP